MEISPLIGIAMKISMIGLDMTKRQVRQAKFVQDLSALAHYQELSSGSNLSTCQVYFFSSNLKESFQ